MSNFYVPSADVSSSAAVVPVAAGNFYVAGPPALSGDVLPVVRSVGPYSADLDNLARSVPLMLFRPGQIVAHTGILGAGKTALMTLFGYAAMVYGRIPVKSSYDAQAAGFYRLQNMFDLLYSEDCLLLLDEFQVLVDSRDSVDAAIRKQYGKYMLYWVDLVRKDKVSIHYTTQSIDKVDVRVRQLTGFIMHASETHIPDVTRVQILRYGGADEALQIGSFLWNRSVVYGSYETRDKKVKLLLDPHAVPVSPFPSRDDLLSLVGDTSHPPRAPERVAPGRGGGSFALSPS